VPDDLDDSEVMVTAPRGNWLRWAGWITFGLVVLALLVNFVSFASLDSTLSCQTSYNRRMASTLDYLHGLNIQQGQQQQTLNRVLKGYPPDSDAVKAARSLYITEQAAILKQRKAHSLPSYHC
jgi:hypothetical protein